MLSCSVQLGPGSVCSQSAPVHRSTCSFIKAPVPKAILHQQNDKRTTTTKVRFQFHRRRVATGASTSIDTDGPSTSGNSSAAAGVYSLERTKTLVETAMLASVSGLTYVLTTVLKLENSLGYFLPLPVILAALRSGALAGIRTTVAIYFLLIVLLGPLRATTYMLIHGLLAASLGVLWKLKVNFWLSIVIGGLVRATGQFAYLGLSSLTMNENLFYIVLGNVYSTLDQITAALGMHGAPSTLAVICLIISLTVVNGLCYCFLLHVIYRVFLVAMGYTDKELGPLPRFIQKYLYGGLPG